jgi:uncharacterized protein DUF4124
MGRMILCMAALALASAAVQAQVYKCVDAKGKTVYSQSPCPQGSRTTTLNSTASAPSVPAASAAQGDSAKAAKPKTTADLEQDFRKRRQQQAETDKKESERLAQAKDKEENCRNARIQLVSLESGLKQARVNEQGERFILDDSQVEQEKARALRAVETNCN